jgi:hypothetical protein
MISFKNICNKYIIDYKKSININNKLPLVDAFIAYSIISALIQVIILFDIIIYIIIIVFI